ncbi:hypothetical protein X975_15036, partial [Stegodyphus mimosarum]
MQISGFGKLGSDVSFCAVVEVWTKMSIFKKNFRPRWRFN